MGNNRKFNKNSTWAVKMDVEVKGSFKSIRDTKINGTYIYNGVLYGTLGLDEDNDYIYYHTDGKAKKFELKYVDPKTKKNIIIKKKNGLSQKIEFVMRNRLDLHLEFIIKKLKSLWYQTAS